MLKKKRNKGDTVTLTAEQIAELAFASLRIAGKYKEELDDYEALFDLQYKRTQEATKLWRAETGQTDVLPDLGELVEWLMVKAGLKAEASK